MSQIMIVGSLNADLVQALPRVPQPGETLLAMDLQVVPGGKGANQAVAAGRLAGHATLIGEVGHDNFVDLLIDSLGGSGVNHSGAGRAGRSTGTAIILVLPNGENLIVVILDPAPAQPLDSSLLANVAHAAAAISVTRFGAQSSIPTRAEVDAFLKTHHLDIHQETPCS